MLNFKNHTGCSFETSLIWDLTCNSDYCWNDLKTFFVTGHRRHAWHCDQGLPPRGRVAQQGAHVASSHGGHLLQLAQTTKLRYLWISSIADFILNVMYEFFHYLQKKPFIINQYLFQWKRAKPPFARSCVTPSTHMPASSYPELPSEYSGRKRKRERVSERGVLDLRKPRSTIPRYLTPPLHISALRWLLDCLLIPFECLASHPPLE